MYTRQALHSEAVTELRKAIGKSFTVTPDMLETPPDSAMGDVAFPCFVLAKGQKRNPGEIATELAAKMAPTELIERIEAKGPYVNFYVRSEAFMKDVFEQLKVAKEKYGHMTTGADKRILVEYGQPNTHKEFHVGHTRNALYGQSVVNAMRANGYEVIPTFYIGDIGAHVAKALWGLKKFHEGEEFAKEDRAGKLGEIYAEATRYLAEHPEVKEEVDAVQRQLEAEEEPWYSLWKETREWSLESFRAIFKELNVRGDVWYYESDVEDAGKKMVQKMLTDGIAKKSEGATIVDLEDEGLGIFLILKSDGSSLYATKDLALAFLKQKQYDPDRQIFVVDVRQSLYFKQLFATLKRMNFPGTLTHLSYDMVTLPDGAMSSRAGNVVTYELLRDTMKARLLEETRKRHEDWSEKKIEEVVHTLTLGAIQFMMLRQDPETELVFDLEEALAFDGYSGPYILYTIARIHSISRQASVKPKEDVSLLRHTLEHQLAKKIADLPMVVERVGKTYQTSSIAMWAFELSKLFAEYYHQVRINDEEDAETTAARLALTYAVRQALENALRILGIETVEEM